MYGTTYDGGANDRGTVFGVTLSGEETFVYSFAGGSGDGSFPDAGLVKVGGTFYGTTLDGGEKDDGTIFSITPAGVEALVHSFASGNEDGAFPEAGMIKSGDTLYGTTTGGGTHGGGTIFAFTPGARATMR